MSYADRLAAVKKEFPDFDVIEKSKSPLMRALGTILFFNPTFMTKFVTTFGRWMWVPSEWSAWKDAVREDVLRHERIHLLQQKRLGFLLFAFLYVLFPLPLGLAWYRARFEWEAYSESIRASAERYGLVHLRDPRTKAYYVSFFTTSAYGWMWPFPDQVGAWYDELLKQLEPM